MTEKNEIPVVRNKDKGVKVIMELNPFGGIDLTQEEDLVVLTNKQIKKLFEFILEHKF